MKMAREYSLIKITSNNMFGIFIEILNGEIVTLLQKLYYKNVM